MDAVVLDAGHNRLNTSSFPTSTIVTWYSKKVQREEATAFYSCLYICFEAIKNFFLSLFYFLQNSTRQRDPADENNSGAFDLAKERFPKIENLISPASHLGLDKQIEISCERFKSKFVEELGTLIKSIQLPELNAIRTFAQDSLNSFNEKLKATIQDNQSNLRVYKEFTPLEIPCLDELEKLEKSWKELEKFQSKFFLNDEDDAFISSYAIQFSFAPFQEKLEAILKEIREKPTSQTIMSWIHEHEVPPFLERLNSDLQAMIPQKQGPLTSEEIGQILAYGRTEIEQFNEKIKAFLREFTSREDDPLEDLISIWKSIERLSQEQDLEKKIELMTEISNAVPDSSDDKNKSIIASIEGALQILLQNDFGFVSFKNDDGVLLQGRVASAISNLCQKLGDKDPSLPQIEMDGKEDEEKRVEGNKKAYKDTAAAVQKTLREFGLEPAISHLMNSVGDIEDPAKIRGILYSVLNQMDTQTKNLFTRSPNLLPFLII